MTFFKNLICVFFALSLAACGGSSGGGEDFTGVVGEGGQKLVVMDPTDNAVFAPGDTITMTIHTENFSLAAPFDRRPEGGITKHHIDPNEVDIEALAEAAEAAGIVEVHPHSEGEPAHSHGEEEMHMHEEGGHDMDDGHAHDDNSLHGDAKEGHYHIYLNDAAGSDPHVTAWSSVAEFTLPEDIPAGNHSLRFELRDNTHVKVGAETIFFFSVSSN